MMGGVSQMGVGGAGLATRSFGTASGVAGKPAAPGPSDTVGGSSLQAPSPPQQGVVPGFVPPPPSDQNVYSKWAMMLQQQLEQAYVERSRILQLAIKLQVENLHLKEALYAENASRFMQLVQVRRDSRGACPGLFHDGAS